MEHIKRRHKAYKCTWCFTSTYTVSERKQRKEVLYGREKQGNRRSYKRVG